MYRSFVRNRLMDFQVSEISIISVCLVGNVNDARYNDG